jgi:hypothetical protein
MTQPANNSGSSTRKVLKSVVDCSSYHGRPLANEKTFEENYLDIGSAPQIESACETQKACQRHRQDAKAHRERNAPKGVQPRIVARLTCVNNRALKFCRYASKSADSPRPMAPVQRTHRAWPMVICSRTSRIEMREVVFEAYDSLSPPVYGRFGPSSYNRSARK